jgi:hypothetical protein
MPPRPPPLDSKGFAEHVSLPNDNSVRRAQLISIQSNELSGVQKKLRFEKNYMNRLYVGIPISLNR